MNFLSVIICALVALAAAKNCPNVKKTNSKLICYYSHIDEVDECYCTHVILPANFQIKQIENLRNKISGVKILLTVNEFNQDLVDTVKKNIIDGLELNLKNLKSKEDVTEFINTIRSKFGDLFLALSIPPKTELLAKYYDLKSLTKNTDLFILQTAFLGASKNVTFHPSRLSGVWDMQNTDSVVDLVTGLGAPLSRLAVTVPVQGFQFKLQDSSLTTPGSPALELKTISRKELCEEMKKQGWTLERDQDQAGPYIFRDTDWIAFEDAISLDIKSKYVRIRGLAGLALKDLSQDFAPKKSENCESLLSAAYAGLSKQNRAPRGAVLRSLEREILVTPGISTGLAQGFHVSPYRITRVVDVEGHVHSVRKDTRTEFTCSRQGYFVHPQSCGRFYRCVKFDQLVDEFSVFEFDCPAGLAFDERVEVCVWPGSLPHGAPCQGSSEIAPVPRGKFNCPSQPGYYADPENCRWFFACLDHGQSEMTAYEFRCPFGLVFDEQNLLCQWPWLVPSCHNGQGTGLELDSIEFFGGQTKTSLTTGALNINSQIFDNYDGLGSLGNIVLGGYQGDINVYKNSLQSHGIENNIQFLNSQNGQYGSGIEGNINLEGNGAYLTTQNGQYGSGIEGNSNLEAQNGQYGSGIEGNINLQAQNVQYGSGNGASSYSNFEGVSAGQNGQYSSGNNGNINLETNGVILTAQNGQYGSENSGNIPINQANSYSNFEGISSAQNGQYRSGNTGTINLETSGAILATQNGQYGSENNGNIRVNQASSYSNFEGISNAQNGQYGSGNTETINLESEAILAAQNGQYGSENNKNTANIYSIQKGQYGSEGTINLAHSGNTANSYSDFDRTFGQNYNRGSQQGNYYRYANPGHHIQTGSSYSTINFGTKLTHIGDNFDKTKLISYAPKYLGVTPKIEVFNIKPTYQLQTSLKDGAKSHSYSTVQHIQTPLSYEQKQPIIYEEKVQQPIIYEQKAQQPIIYEQKVQQPIIHYEQKVQQPISYEQKVEQPIIYEQKVEQPIIYEQVKPTIKTNLESAKSHSFSQIHHIQSPVQQYEQKVEQPITYEQKVQPVVLKSELGGIKTHSYSTTNLQTPVVQYEQKVQPTIQVQYEQKVQPAVQVQYEQKIQPTVQVQYEQKVPVVQYETKVQPILSDGAKSHSYSSINHYQTQKIAQPIVQQQIEIKSAVVPQYEQKIQPQINLYQEAKSHTQFYGLQEYKTPNIQKEIFLPKVETKVEIVPEIKQKVYSTSYLQHVQQPVVQYEQKVQQPIVYEQKVQQPIVYEQKAQQPIIYEEKVEQPIIYKQEIQQPIIHYEQKVQQPIVYEQKIEQPIVHYEQKVQKPIVYEQKVQQPVVNEHKIQQHYEQKVQQPIVHFEQKVQQPIVYEQKIEQPIVHYEQKVQKPIVYEQKVQQPVVYEHKIQQHYEQKVQQPIVHFEQKVQQPIVYEQKVQQPVVYEHKIQQHYEQKVQQPIVHFEQKVQQPIVYEQKVQQPIIYEQKVQSVHKTNLESAKSHSFSQIHHIQSPVQQYEQKIQQPVVHYEQKVQQPIVYEQKVQQPIIHEQKVQQPIIFKQEVQQPIIHYEQKVQQPIVYEQKVQQPIIYEQKVQKPAPFISVTPKYETNSYSTIKHQINIPITVTPKYETQYFKNPIKEVRFEAKVPVIEPKFVQKFIQPLYTQSTPPSKVETIYFDKVTSAPQITKTYLPVRQEIKEYITPKPVIYVSSTQKPIVDGYYINSTPKYKSAVSTTPKYSVFQEFFEPKQTFDIKKTVEITPKYEILEEYTQPKIYEAKKVISEYQYENPEFAHYQTNLNTENIKKTVPIQTYQTDYILSTPKPNFVSTIAPITKQTNILRTKVVAINKFATKDDSFYVSTPKQIYISTPAPIITKTQIPLGEYRYYDSRYDNLDLQYDSTPKTTQTDYILSTPKPNFISTIAPITKKTNVLRTKVVAIDKFATKDDNYFVSTPKQFYISTPAPIITKTQIPLGEYRYSDSRFDNLDLQYETTPKIKLTSIRPAQKKKIVSTTPIFQEYYDIISTKSPVTTYKPKSTTIYDENYNNEYILTTSRPTIRPIVVKKKKIITTTEPIDYDYYISTTKPSVKITPRPKSKTIVKVNDFHPFLTTKLGAQCTCSSNTVKLRKNKQKDQDYDIELPENVPVTKITQSGPVAYDDYNEPGVYVVGNSDYDNYEAKKIVAVTKSPEVRLKTTTDQIQSAPSPNYIRKKVSDKSKEEKIAEAVNEGLSLVKSAIKGYVKDAIQEEVRNFDRYGPGGWRSRDETLQGSVDCKRPGLFRHPTQCNKFYSCTWDCTKQRYTLAVFNCPVHLTFDTSQGACNWPSKGPACTDNTLLPSA